MSELAQPFAMSLPAIMKHLDVLSDAGLITRTKTGRTVACRLSARPMEQAMDWLSRYQRFWSENLDRLAAFVEEEQWPPNQALGNASAAGNTGLAPDRASPSNVASMRAPAKVYAAWTDPEKIARLVWARAGQSRLGAGGDRPADRRALSHQPST